MKTLLLSFAIVFLSTGILLASPKDAIERILVEGTEIVGKGVVTAVLKSKDGEVYDPGTVTDDIKRIYDTGFFSAVQVDVRETYGKG